MKIEKNIPIPSLSKYAEQLKTVEVGDSWTCTLTEAASYRAQARALGYSVKSRTINPNEVRLWRIA
jgi:hypothetical protein